MSSEKFTAESADLVIIFKKLKSIEDDEIRTQWSGLIQKLDKSEFHYCVEQLSANQLAVFIKCPSHLLDRLWYMEASLDWARGIGFSELEPPKVEKNVSLTRAHKTRLIHQFLIQTEQTGGLGIKTVSFDPSSCIETIHVPHDDEYLKKWVGQWTKGKRLELSDLDQVRENLGEEVAFYFAFLQFYTISLSIPSALGLLFYFCGLQFSQITWATGTVHLWIRRSNKMARRWNVQNCSKLQIISPSFVPDFIYFDRQTGERNPSYPTWKRVATILGMTIPAVVVFTLLLATLLFGILLIEMYFSHRYFGPGRSLLIHLPTILYVAFIPGLSQAYTSIAKALNFRENWKTIEQLDNALTQKLFVLSSIVGLLDLVAYGLIVIPFQRTIFGLTPKDSLPLSKESFHARYFYYMVTAQIINAFQEVVLPMVLKKSQGMIASKSQAKDKPLSKFVEKIKREIDMPEYNVFEDYLEMVLQFGYLLLFSCSWTLAPLVCFINNVVEVRSDAIKISTSRKMPLPKRRESIGPWVQNMSVLVWIGSFTLPILCSIFGDNSLVSSSASTQTENAWTVATTVLVFEHFYLLINYIFSLLNDKQDVFMKRKQFEKERELVSRCGVDLTAGKCGGEVSWSTEALNEDPVALGIALSKINDLFE